MLCNICVCNISEAEQCMKIEKAEGTRMCLLPPTASYPVSKDYGNLRQVVKFQVLQELLCLSVDLQKKAEFGQRHLALPRTDRLPLQLAQLSFLCNY